MNNANEEILSEIFLQFSLTQLNEKLKKKIQIYGHEYISESIEVLKFAQQRLPERLVECIINSTLNDLIEYNSVVYNRVYFQETSNNRKFTYIQQLYSYLTKHFNFTNEFYVFEATFPKTTTQLLRIVFYSLNTDWVVPKCTVIEFLHRVLEMMRVSTTQMEIESRFLPLQLECMSQFQYVVKVFYHNGGIEMIREFFNNLKDHVSTLCTSNRSEIEERLKNSINYCFMEIVDTNMYIEMVKYFIEEEMIEYDLIRDVITRYEGDIYVVDGEQKKKNAKIVVLKYIMDIPERLEGRDRINRINNAMTIVRLLLHRYQQKGEIDQIVREYMMMEGTFSGCTTHNSLSSYVLQMGSLEMIKEFEMYGFDLFLNKSTRISVLLCFAVISMSLEVVTFVEEKCRDVFIGRIDVRKNNNNDGDNVSRGDNDDDSDGDDDDDNDDDSDDDDDDDDYNWRMKREEKYIEAIVSAIEALINRSNYNRNASDDDDDKNYYRIFQYLEYRVIKCTSICDLSPSSPLLPHYYPFLQRLMMTEILSGNVEIIKQSSQILSIVGTKRFVFGNNGGISTHRMTRFLCSKFLSVEAIEAIYSLYPQFKAYLERFLNSTSVSQLSALTSFQFIHNTRMLQTLINVLSISNKIYAIDLWVYKFQKCKQKCIFEQ